MSAQQDMRKVEVNINNTNVSNDNEKSANSQPFRYLRKENFNWRASRIPQPLSRVIQDQTGRGDYSDFNKTMTMMMNDNKTTPGSDSSVLVHVAGGDMDSCHNNLSATKPSVTFSCPESILSATVGSHMLETQSGGVGGFPTRHNNNISSSSNSSSSSSLSTTRKFDPEQSTKLLIDKLLSNSSSSSSASNKESRTTNGNNSTTLSYTLNDKFKTKSSNNSTSALSFNDLTTTSNGLDDITIIGDNRQQNPNMFINSDEEDELGVRDDLMLNNAGCLPKMTENSPYFILTSKRGLNELIQTVRHTLMEEGRRDIPPELHEDPHAFYGPAPPQLIEKSKRK